MRRQFLRIPGSPQATPFVETPAHSAPTLFNGVWLFLSEVVIGNVEPTMFLCPYTGTRLQIYEISTNNRREWTKKLNLARKWLNGDTSSMEFLYIRNRLGRDD